jgi:hypothetical protein
MLVAAAAPDATTMIIGPGRLRVSQPLAAA